VKEIVRSDDDDDEDTRPSAPIRHIEKEAAVTELLGTGSQMPCSLYPEILLYVCPDCVYLLLCKAS
jgi:hypothetical protein